MKNKVTMNARIGLISRVIRIANSKRGIRRPAVLKIISKERSGRGEKCNMRPRKRLKRGGWE
jgi:hypothetical protein